MYKNVIISKENVDISTAKAAPLLEKEILIKIILVIFEYQIINLLHSPFKSKYKNRMQNTI